MRTYCRFLILTVAVLALAGCGGLGKLLPMDDGPPDVQGEYSTEAPGKVEPKYSTEQPGDSPAVITPNKTDEYTELERAEKAGAAAKVTNLTEATEGADGDLMAGVDVSDTTMAASGTTKGYPLSVIKTYVMAAPGTIGGTTPATSVNADELDLTASSDPVWGFKDSDSGDTDKTISRIKSNAGTTTAGSVDADIWIDVLQGGSWVEVLRFDESDDQWESTKVMDFAILDPASDITATTIQAALAEFAAAIELNTAKETNTDDQTAAEVTVADTGENFTGENVEAVLAELFGALHSAVTLGTSADNNLLSLSTQAIDLDTQTANYGFFGPTTGDAAAPSFRAMVTADIPNDIVTPAKISDWYAYDVIPIAWAKDGTSAPDALDDGSTRSPYQYRTFASDSTEDVNFVWFVPSDLSGSTIQYRVKYLVTNATGPSNEGVAFALAGISAGDNDATNGTKGTAVVVTDTAITAAQHDILITGWSGDVTVTDLAAGEIAEMNFARDHDDAADDYGQVVGVLAVEIRYVQNVAK